MNTIHRSIVISSILLLGSCDNSVGVKGDDLSSVLAENEIVVASVTIGHTPFFDGPVMGFSYIKDEPRTSVEAALNLRRHGGDLKLWSGFQHGTPSDFTDTYGKLYTRTFTPGNWFFGSAYYGPDMDFTLPHLDLVAEPGKIVYVGDFHVEMREQKNALGTTTQIPERITVIDSSARDIPLLLSQYPTLRRDQITIAVLDDAPWRISQEPTYQYHTPLPPVTHTRH